MPRPRRRRRRGLEVGGLVLGIVAGLGIVLGWLISTRGQPPRPVVYSTHPPVVIRGASVASAEPDPAALDAEWAAYSNHASCADWAGGDGVSAIRLNSSQLAWFFSDTYLGPAGPTIGFSHLSGFMHNSVVVQTTTGPGSTFVTLTGGGACPGPGRAGDAAPVVGPPPTGSGVSADRYWEEDAIRTGGTIVKFYNHYLGGTGLIAPVLAFVVAGIAILTAYLVVGRQRPGPVARGFRLGQFVTSSLFALAHGTNDAQKTMGIITLALIANGNLPGDSFEVPTWVIVASASAIALGTWSGGWRIIKTMGTRIIKMDPAQGFAAQGTGAAVLFSATALGYPLSTTHVISGAVMGSGAAKSVSAVRWGIAGNILTAWGLTLPAAATISALAYGVCSIFGPGALGPVLVALCGVGLLLAIFGRRAARLRAPSPSLPATTAGAEAH